MYIYKIMISIFKHRTYDQLCEELESSCDKTLKEYQSFINSFRTPLTFTRPNDHIEMMNILERSGFTNSKKVVENLKVRNNFQIQSYILSKYMSTVKSITDIKRYNKEATFVTLNQFNKICKKYGLIHKPVDKYIKDVPEDNLKDLNNNYSFYRGRYSKNYSMLYLSSSNFQSGNKKLFDKIVKSGLKVMDHSIANDAALSMNKIYYIDCKYNTIDRSFKDVIREGAFIAAPRSHFKGQFNLFKPKVNSCIIFEYCNIMDGIEFTSEDIIKVITKWNN